jgi:predicted DNA-binding antitoxin AbrB/MazE fold protein
MLGKPEEPVMSDKTNNGKRESSERAAVTLPGTVEKVIPAIDPRDGEKAQIAVEGADELYREIRVENKLQDATGKEVSLKPGAHVDVTIEAAPNDIVDEAEQSKE